MRNRQPSALVRAPAAKPHLFEYQAKTPGRSPLRIVVLAAAEAVDRKTSMSLGL
jgi:hypothetical protein